MTHTGIDRLQAPQTEKERTARDQAGGGKRHAQYRQPVAARTCADQSLATTAHRFAGLAAGAQHACEQGDQRCQCSQTCRGDKHLGVDDDGIHARQAAACEFAQGIDAEHRQHHAQCHGQSRQQADIQQLIAQQSRPTCAQRLRHRLLVAPCGLAHVDQDRGIGTGNQQHQQSQHEGAPERAAHIADDRIQQGPRPQLPLTELLFLMSDLLDQRGGERIQPLRQHRRTDRRIEPRHGIHGTRLPRPAPFQREGIAWHRTPCTAGEIEIRRHHARHTQLAFRCFHAAPDHARIATEQALPFLMRKNHRIAALEILRHETVAEQRRAPQRREQTLAHHERGDAAREFAIEYGDVVPDVVTEMRERHVRFGQPHGFQRRQIALRDAGFGTVAFHRHHVLGLGERQAAEHAAQHAQHDRAEGDAERQHQQHGETETGRVRKTAQRDVEVLDKRGDHAWCAPKCPFIPAATPPSAPPATPVAAGRWRI